MSSHPFYGLLYIILLPFALLLGLSALLYLLLATQMPAFLLAAFITGCFVIYTVATLIFYIKAVQQSQACKPSLRDWIRVNAFVIILPSLYVLVVVTATVVKPDLLTKALQQAQDIQGQKLPFSIGVIRVLLYALAMYMAALLIHIIYTFRLLKTYRSSFGDNILNSDV